MSMGSTHQGKQGITTQFRSSGRGFAAVDPERQREIDLEHARMIAKRVHAAYQGTGRAAPVGWLPSYRDPADEGGSVRRSR
jgi:hypothetical protein